MLLCKANAKINLGLDILGKRADGYHDVDMVMLPIKLADTLTFTLTQTPEIELETNEYLGEIKQNLVYRAAKVLQDTYAVTQGVKIVLEKNVPAAAGLGGGSSDCAFTLKALNKLWNLQLSQEQLHEHAQTLGADVPFFLSNVSTRVQGFGEKLQPIDVKKSYQIVLIKPTISVATKEAYQVILPSDRLGDVTIPSLIAGLKEDNRQLIVEHMANSFERSFFQKYPEMEALKQTLIAEGYNVVLSGSGPTLLCFDVSDGMVRELQEKMRGSDFKIIVTETMNDE